MPSRQGLHKHECLQESLLHIYRSISCRRKARWAHGKGDTRWLGRIVPRAVPSDPCIFPGVGTRGRVRVAVRRMVDSRRTGARGGWSGSGAEGKEIGRGGVEEGEVNHKDFSYE
jgi:hypothetical protein